MNLPLELVDEIVSHLPSDDKQSLRNCSLVAKSWIHPSQRLLFEKVEIDQRNLQSWVDNISPTNTVLLGQIRQFSYKEYPKAETEPAHCTLRDYFPSFRQLRHLTLLFASFQPHHTKLFSTFQHSLSTISLSGCSITKNAFVTLINYFPNLAHLHLRGLSCHEKDEPSLPLSRLLFKSLYVTVWRADSLFLLDELSRSGLRFEEVIVSGMIPKPSWPEFTRRVVGIFGAHVKYLRIRGSPEGKHSLPRPVLSIPVHNPSADGESFLTLSHCRELREFEAYLLHANDAELDLVSSITSTKIEKITFAHSPAFDLPTRHTYWARLDDVLVELVGRSEYKLRLEVEFQGVYVAPSKKSESYLTKRLPKFVEKGRMVVLGPGGNVLYCSDEAKGERK